MNNFENIDWSPEKYAEASFLSRKAGEELLSRLDWMSLKPQRILDVGCGLGEQSQLLQRHYPGVQIIALDLSEAMLKSAKQQYGKEENIFFLCSDANNLPLANQCIDLIFANFFLPWQRDMPAIFREWRRVLRPDGLLMLSTLGLDTMKEWPDAADIVPNRVDMHDIGDLLVQAGFAGPVLDTQYVTLVYREKDRLLSELSAMEFIRADASIAANDQLAKWPITCEMIYAHAFSPSQVIGEDGEVSVSLKELKESLVRRRSS